MSIKFNPNENYYPNTNGFPSTLYDDFLRGLTPDTIRLPTEACCNPKPKDIQYLDPNIHRAGLLGVFQGYVPLHSVKPNIQSSIVKLPMRVDPDEEEINNRILEAEQNKNQDLDTDLTAKTTKTTSITPALPPRNATSTPSSRTPALPPRNAKGIFSNIMEGLSSFWASFISFFKFMDV